MNISFVGRDIPPPGTNVFVVFIVVVIQVEPVILNRQGKQKKFEIAEFKITDSK